MSFEKIIVVDDSKMARMFTVRCLQITGCKGAEFTEAEDGVVALDVLKQKGADLVVTDLNMPNMSGTELLKTMRQDESTKDIPVIVVTSAGNPAKEEELTKLGANAIIHKPVAPPKLVPIMKELLSE